MAIKYIQKETERHLFALYKLINPTNWRMYPNKFSNGTAKVKGIENDDKIEVTVEM